MTKKNTIILITLLLGFFASGQVKLSEFVQKSKIAKTETNKLYFIDFWATWCVPCVTAKEQLGVLQKQFPKDFYIVSVSNENPLKVERYIKNKPADLAIATDYYNETHRKYNVSSLPYGVLLDAKGNLLWEGSSADLKAHTISRYLNQTSSKASVKSFFQVITAKNEVNNEYVPKEEIEIKPLTKTIEDIEVIDNSKYLKLSGKLKAIVGYLAKIYKDQIEIDNNLNTTYEVYLKKPLNTKENLALKLVTQMDFKVKRREVNGESLALDFDEPRFWDTNQIDWGSVNKYLIGDSDIIADNVSLKDISYQLAKVLDIPVIIKNEDSRSFEKHDWEIHYKFFQLMKTSLNDNYGIKVKREKLSYPVYTMIKK